VYHISEKAFAFFENVVISGFSPKIQRNKQDADRRKGAEAKRTFSVCCIRQEEK